MRSLRRKRAYGLFVSLVTGFSVWLIASVALAETFCVSDETELQAALDEAAINNQDDFIKIRQGTYYGSFTYNSTEAYSLTSKGGYYHPRCKKRVVDPANTVLDGQNNGSVLSLSAPNVNTSITISGLTLRNGNPYYMDGGGLYVNAVNSGLNLNETVIRNSYSNGDGGGAYISANSVNLTNNQITNNQTGISDETSGGGVYLEASNAIVSNNVFSYNHSKYRGGGVYIQSINTDFFDNVVSNNSSNGGGGISIMFGSKVTLVNNNINQNHGKQYGGGGVWVRQVGDTSFIKNEITDNTSDQNGGGVRMYDTNKSYFASNNISLNSCQDHGGGISFQDSIDIILLDNLITKNGASGMGGGLSVSPVTTLSVINNTITMNSGDLWGGGIHFRLNADNDSADLYNNIIWDNNSLGEGSDLYIMNDGDFNSTGSEVNLYSNDFDQSIAGTYIQVRSTVNEGNNLDNEDPLFDIDGYHLTDTSPCIDAGTDAGVYDDIDGDSRPQGSGYDIGADEFIALDLDIARCTATKRVCIGGNKNIVKISLAVVNAGAANSGKKCPANVIGMQDSVEVYNETMGVSDQIGKGQTIFQFPDYIPAEEGEIIWTATVDDDDPDDDTATTVTSVK